MNTHLYKASSDIGGLWLDGERTAGDLLKVCFLLLAGSAHLVSVFDNDEALDPLVDLVVDYVVALALMLHDHFFAGALRGHHPHHQEIRPCQPRVDCEDSWPTREELVEAGSLGRDLRGLALVLRHSGHRSLAGLGVGVDLHERRLVVPVSAEYFAPDRDLEGRAGDVDT